MPYHRAVAAVGVLLSSACDAAGLMARQKALEKAWGAELDAPAAKERVNPVKRVVNLLQKMRDELEAEANKDSELYDKMVCWCETTEKEKKQAISDAEARDKELTAEIEERAGKFGNLAATIEQTKKEIAENTATLEKATEIREAEAATFREEEKEKVQAVTNLRNAVAVLAKHQTTQAMLQINKGLLEPMRVVLRDCALKLEVYAATRAERSGTKPSVLLALRESTRTLGAGSLGPDAAILFSALDVNGGAVPDSLPVIFAQRLVAQAAKEAAASRTFLQTSARQPLFESRSSGRSAGIYGVLQQMLEEFEAELSTSQKEELQAQEDFKGLAATKTQEIEVGKQKLDQMQEQDAGNAKALSDAKEDLENTRKQRSEDVKFLQNLQTTCNDLDAQWEKRRNTRTAEIQAVSEALVILTEDDNREMLGKSVSLIQLHASVSAHAAARRAGAAAALRRAAASPDFDADDLLAAWHGRGSAPRLGVVAAGPRGQLSTLAVAAQLDSFTKVKEMMDTMVAELKKQQAEEVKFKDYCSTELDANEKTTYDKTQHKTDLETDMARLEALMKQLSEEIAQSQAQIGQTEVDIKKASQTREEENKNSQSIVSDQRATQTILAKVLAKLKDFYHKGIGKEVFAQRAAQTPPVQFNDFKTNAGASPVIGMIEQIVEDSKALEAETTAGETKGQADYQQFVADGNALIKDLQAGIASKTQASAQAAEDNAQAGTDHGNTVAELDSLAQYGSDLHAECDWSLKNFDVRQKARLAEIEAIQQAKGILSGAGSK